MHPDQAIEILDRLAARAPATRADHIAAAQAVQALQQFVAATTLLRPPGEPSPARAEPSPQPEAEERT